QAHSNPRTPRHTWTAAAPTQDSYTAATRPYTSSRIVGGGGVATGRLLSTTNTLSGHDRSRNSSSCYTPWAFCRTAAVSTTIYCVLAKSSLCTQQMTVFPFNEVFAGRCQSRER